MVVFSDIIVCLHVSNLASWIVGNRGKGQKEQIGSLSSQNVGLKVHALKPKYFICERTLETPSRFLFICLKHISIGMIFCLEEENLKEMRTDGGRVIGWKSKQIWRRQESH